MLRKIAYWLVAGSFVFTLLPAADSTLTINLLPPGIIQKRQPNWIAKTLVTYSGGQPRNILFYAPLAQGGGNAPIQLVTFDEAGTVREEVDLTVVGAKHPSAVALGTTVIPHGHAVTYYPNGSVASIVAYHEGVLHGAYQCYYQSGQAQTRASYSNGLLDGEFKDYHPNGLVVSEGRYSAGKLDGPFTCYSAKGQKSLAMTYVNGLPNGEALEWYESQGVKLRRFFEAGLLQDNGTTPALTLYDEEHHVVETQAFRRGQPCGTHVRYYASGQESYHQHYKNGDRIGKESFFGADGTLLGQGEYLQGVPVGEHYRKDAETGATIYLARYDRQGHLLQPIVEWYPNGTKMTQYRLANGALTGEYLQYYPDGQLKHRYHYSKGEFEGPQEDFYANGSLKKRASYQLGMRHGLYEEWNSSGVLVASIPSRNGARDGMVQLWFGDGHQKSRASYSEGLEEGERREWDEDGTLVLSAHYISGIPDGSWEEWYPSGQLKRKASFVEGKPSNKEELYYPNGQLQRSVTYVNGLLEGPWREWYPEGSLKTEGLYAKGAASGPWLEYYPLLPTQEKPQISRQLSYRENAFDGDQLTFYFDGTKQSIMRYRQGISHGIKELWARDGELLQQTDYENGLVQGRHFEKKGSGEVIIASYVDNRLEGPYQLFFPPNEKGERIKALEANYSAGQYEGEVRAYDREGNKVGSTFYRNGLKDGAAAVFNPSGATVLVATFVAGQREGPSFEYFPSGVLRREVTYALDVKEGEEKTYYEDGRLAAIATYSKGQLNGPSRTWNADGILTFEGTYRNDKRHGPFNKYYDDGTPKVQQVFVDDELKPGSKQTFAPDGSKTEKESAS